MINRMKCYEMAVKLGFTSVVVLCTHTQNKRFPEIDGFLMGP